MPSSSSIASAPVSDPHVVQAFERGLRVIRALSHPLSPSSPGLTLSDVAAATELSRATARRFLQTLVALGYARTDGRTFELTARVLELGYAYLAGLSLPTIARPHLQALLDKVGESCSVSVLDGDDIVFVARATSRRVVTVGVDVGTRFPAYPNAMGRVLLASLPAEELDAYFERATFEQFTTRTRTSERSLRAELRRIRDRGYALVDQEHDEDVRSVAVPVTDDQARTVAAVNISTSASRTSLESMLQELLPALRSTAAEIAADLRVHPSASLRS